jgi:hypothetical protein
MLNLAALSAIRIGLRKILIEHRHSMFLFAQKSIKALPN